ncbi:MAG: uroporphyrinogen decarboxylase [Armatimonadota bacterium]|nr:uroporphyrinogen decarboxylase [Armatimonadota bacterium]MDR5696373.1 uroporphyrinogen decarboxylase [Armatimonadota bacterium]
MSEPAASGPTAEHHATTVSFRDRILRAARRQPVDTTPVWFMRQAGRYLPEYRALRERYTMEDLCRHPDLATEVTLQPLRRLDVDAAIVFSDLLVPLWGMGLGFHVVEGQGPVLQRSLSADELASLPAIDLGALEFTFQAIRTLRRELDRPLIGFAGAPFTFAAYLIEGQPSRDWTQTRAFIHAQPDAWERLMARLAESLGAYLRAQVEAGAHLVQVFDSWAGAVSARTFRRAVAPHLHRMLDAVGPRAPRIYFATGNAHLLREVAGLPAEVIGVDWRVGLPDAAAVLGAGRALQGNLDPALLSAPVARLRTEAERVVDEGASLPGHIFNLGHGVPPHTDPDRLRRLVDWVHERGRRTPGGG